MFGELFHQHPVLQTILFADLTDGLYVAPSGIKSSLSEVPLLIEDHELQTMARTTNISAHLPRSRRATASLGFAKEQVFLYSYIGLC